MDVQDDEMGSAVNLQTRQLRKIMNELHQDHLVCECVEGICFSWYGELRRLTSGVCVYVWTERC